MLGIGVGSVAMLPSINYCVSLGPGCQPAEFLKNHPSGLRRFALPFDWIRTDVALVATCLDDSFQLLLQRHLMESARWTSLKRRGRHKLLRTPEREDIFGHHDPAAIDDDYKSLHRSTDRLRRILGDSHSRTLFLHLEVDSDPRTGDAFVRDAEKLYASLRRVTRNFDLMAVRVVYRPCEAPSLLAAEAPEIELRFLAEPSFPTEPSFPGMPRIGAPTDAPSEGMLDGTISDGLHVLELPSCTRTVVPFTTWREEPSAAELCDVAALTSVLNRRFSFEEIRETPPECTAVSRAARAACGPQWVWASPPQVPRETATPSELLLAAACLPGGTNTALALLGADPVPPVERIGPDARQAALAGGEVEVAAWAQEWMAQAEQAGVEMSEAEWRAASERLALPPMPTPRLAHLVTRALIQQLAEMRAIECYVG